VTDDAQNPSPAADEPVTEERTVVVPGTPAAGAPAGASAGSGTPAAHTRAPVPPPVPPVVEAGPQSGPSLTDKVAALIDERPEVGAGGAFVGGIVLAMILKRLGR
jgi:hypothetical protein